MAKRRSMRADLLRRVLKDINAGNYDEYNRFIVFGAPNLFDMIDDVAAAPSDREDHSLEDAAHQLVSDSKLHDGRSKVADRISLGQRPNFKTDALTGLTAEQRTAFSEILTKVLEEKSASAEHGRTPSDVGDELDAAFAEELLGKLPKIVDRALSLDELSLARVPNEDVKRYFEEAHHCYLYGFHVACAVLCRAILASALENVCDPNGTIQKNVKPGESYFKALVSKAGRDGLLTDDRPQCANNIRDAGNDSIHNFEQFKRRWANKIDEILVDTRKVLLDLYARPR